MKQNKTIRTEYKQLMDFDFEHPQELLDYMTNIIENIPQSLRHTAVMDFDINNSNASFAVEYTRLETNKEYSDRVNRAAAIAKQNKDKDIAELTRLLSIYGPQADGK